MKIIMEPSCSIQMATILRPFATSRTNEVNETATNEVHTAFNVKGVPHA
jgi:hypothetical protein